jgi:hypothetical protein
MYNFESFSKEENKFIKQHINSARCTAQTYKKVTLILFGVFGHIATKKQDKNYTCLIMITLGYLSGLLSQHYMALLDALENGYRMSAACLFRMMLEVYIDLEYLLNNPELAERYIDYSQVSSKRFVVTSSKQAKLPTEEIKFWYSEYNDFKKKYKIIDHEKLRTWSGLSIREMCQNFFSKQENWAENIQVLYVGFSNFTHPSSIADDVLFGEIPSDKELNDSLHYSVRIPFFNGCNILCASFVSLAHFFSIDNLDEYENAKKEFVETFKVMNTLQSAESKWRDLTSSFYEN